MKKLMDKYDKLFDEHHHLWNGVVIRTDCIRNYIYSITIHHMRSMIVYVLFEHCSYHFMLYRLTLTESCYIFYINFAYYVYQGMHFKNN